MNQSWVEKGFIYPDDAKITKILGMKVLIKYIGLVTPDF